MSSKVSGRELGENGQRNNGSFVRMRGGMDVQEAEEKKPVGEVVVEDGVYWLDCLVRDVK